MRPPGVMVADPLPAIPVAAPPPRPLRESREHPQMLLAVPQQPAIQEAQERAPPQLLRARRLALGSWHGAGRAAAGTASAAPRGFGVWPTVSFRVVVLPAWVRVIEWVR